MTIVILGAGIGGLSTAYYLLKKQARKVILLEASNRVGGWIRSDHHERGVILEQGPRTLRPKGEAGANTLGLIEELKLEDRIRPILSTSSAAKNRFIYANGKLYTLPSSFKSLFRSVPPFSKPLARSLVHDWKSKAKYVEDDSIYSFVQRRFGKDIADYAISPLMCGICGGDAREISVNFLLSDLFEKEQKYGSITRAYLRPWNWKIKSKANFNSLAKKASTEKWSSYSFLDGLEILPQVLKTQVEAAGGVIITNSNAEKIDFRKRLLQTSEEEMSFDFLVSAIPAPSLSSLLFKNNYLLANELQKINYTSIVTVNLIYKKKLLDKDGFGFLVPPSENLPILGVIFDHSYAPVEDWTILTVMMGGHSFNKYFADNCSEEYVVKIAQENVAKILNIKETPDVCRVSVLRDSIPQQTIGHKKRITWIENHIQLEKLPLFLVGNAYRGTGINDVILSAKKTAEKIEKYGKEERSDCYTPRYVVDYL